MDYKSLAVVAIIATAILILITQIITEVIKSVTSDENSKYNIITVITAVIITVLTYVIFCSIKGYAMLWYYFIAAVIYGVFIAYGAMVGYDKLIKKVFSAIKEAKDTASKIQ